MKTFKKVITLLLVVALTAAISIGGTVAYLSDSDAQVNTFTNGNVYIDLWEDFGDNDGIEHLMPAVGSAQDGTLKNGIEKEVYVTNTGTEPAYVRVHIAIPTLLDDGAVTFDASKNIVHFNYAPESVGAGLWDWSNTSGAPYEGEWNFSKFSIDGVDYNVYTVTYEKALVPGESTVDAMSQVYLDSEVTNEDIEKLNAALGEEWKIYVCAEATQAAGFENAYEALNTAFGGIPTEEVWKEVTGATFVESNSVFPAYVSGDVNVDEAGAYVARVQADEYVIYDNANIVSKGGGVNAYGKTVFNSGSITLNNATSSPRHVFYVAARESDATVSGSLVINDGEFTFNPTNLTRRGSYICADGSDVVVNGGTFHKPSTRTDPIQAINGGTVTIYGGSFAFDPSAYVAEGYQAVQGENGYWTVSAAQA